jgi:hypothetical protein
MSVWGNKVFWLRVAVIASLVWIGVIVIASATARNFAWAHGYYSSEPGPATITAIAGVLVIWVCCLGIPWISDTTKSDG